jgi:hypothetical protein
LLPWICNEVRRKLIRTLSKKRKLIRTSFVLGTDRKFARALHREIFSFFFCVYAAAAAVRDREAAQREVCTCRWFAMCDLI